MERLATEQRMFTATDGGTIKDEAQRQKMLSNFMAPKVLHLRLDAQVMLVKNVDETLVNGSMGRVMRFVNPTVYGTELDLDGGAGGGGVAGGSTMGSVVGSAVKKGSAAVGGMEYPVVQFLLPSGTQRTVIVLPEVWKVELPSGEIQVSRTQVCRV